MDYFQVTGMIIRPCLRGLPFLAWESVSVSSLSFILLGYYVHHRWGGCKLIVSRSVSFWTITKQKTKSGTTFWTLQRCDFLPTEFELALGLPQELFKCPNFKIGKNRKIMYCEFIVSVASNADFCYTAIYNNLCTYFLNAWGYFPIFHFSKMKISLRSGKKGFTRHSLCRKSPRDSNLLSNMYSKIK